MRPPPGKIRVKFERLISNNKENKNFAPPWDAPGKNIFFQISLIDMEILVFKFEHPISNNKENKNFASPWDAPGKKIFFLNFFD